MQRTRTPSTTQTKLKLMYRPLSPMAMAKASQIHIYVTGRIQKSDIYEGLAS
jgi:hypothetical protein